MPVTMIGKRERGGKAERRIQNDRSVGGVKSFTTEDTENAEENRRASVILSECEPT